MKDPLIHGTILLKEAPAMPALIETVERLFLYER
jgi:hypothetical protein